MMACIANLLMLMMILRPEKDVFCRGQIQSGAPWPMFGRNQLHSSNTPFFTNTTSRGNLRWKFSTGNNIHSAPSIGSDGTIYFGDDNGVLYAINSLGGVVWSYQTGGEETYCSLFISCGNICL